MYQCLCIKMCVVCQALAHCTVQQVTRDSCDKPPKVMLLQCFRNVWMSLIAVFINPMPQMGQ